MTRNAPTQLVHFLSDMYSVEQQALAQLATAPDMAGDPLIAEDFARHYEQTESQADRVGARLEAHGGSPSALKDAVMKLGGKGFLLFARLQPETPGKLVDHAYAYEAMEWAGYELLARFARQAGDEETVAVAEAIGAEERAMMERLALRFDAAEEASHGDTPREELDDHVRAHLADVHAFERQSEALLKKSQDIGGDPAVNDEHQHMLEVTQTHAQRVEQRLESLGADSSRLKDNALALGGSNWGLFFQAQSDTPAKLAGFVYAVLHLEIGGYELLKRTALRASDAETARLCSDIIAEKRQLADRLAARFDDVVEATLEAVAR